MYLVADGSAIMEGGNCDFLFCLLVDEIELCKLPFFIGKNGVVNDFESFGFREEVNGDTFIDCLFSVAFVLD